MTLLKKKTSDFSLSFENVDRLLLSPNTKKINKEIL